MKIKFYVLTDQKTKRLLKQSLNQGIKLQNLAFTFEKTNYEKHIQKVSLGPLVGVIKHNYREKKNKR